MLLRKIIVRRTGIELRKDELLRVILKHSGIPLYGLAEAGDYWAKILSSHLLEKLQFSQTPAYSVKGI